MSGGGEVQSPFIWESSLTATWTEGDYLDWKVQSPFIWESSLTRQYLADWNAREKRVQSPFIWESSLTGSTAITQPGEVQSPFIWESSLTGTS